jgi:hypothetical protein
MAPQARRYKRFSSLTAVYFIDSSWEKLVPYINKPLDHLILNGFHARSEYFQAGNDHFTLFGLEF